MNKDQQIAELKRAIRIAAEMFSADGYVTEGGNGSQYAIELWLRRKAREELAAENRKPGTLA